MTSESGLSEITSELIRSALCETIENRFNSKKYEIKIESASQVANNFIGIIYRVFFEMSDGIDDEKGFSRR